MLPTPSVLLSFALVVGLLTITPGVDTAVVVRSAAVDGRRKAWGAIMGIQSGVLVWGALAAVGVSALLTASEIAYTALRIAGAVYLVWLGGRMLWSAVRGSAAPHLPADMPPGTFVDGWRQGFLTNLLNPKVGAFYVALLPQFIPAAAPHLTWGLSLALVHVLLGIMWLGALTLVAHTARRWLQRPAVVRSIDGVAGGVIALFGIRLALPD